MRRFVPYVLGGLLAITLAACGGGGTGPVTVTGVTVTPESPSVAVGSTVALSATVAPSNASQNVTWSSAAPAVATVNPSGVVTGVSEGTTLVTATSVADTSRSGSVTVTVTAAGTDPDPDEDPITVVCDGTGVISENITTATTITPDCYRVTSNITVSAPLTIERGTVLEFTANSGLRIADGGSMRAVGTVVNPIRFTSVSRDSNDWRGIGFFTSSSENVLAHVVVENAGRTFGVINGSNATNVYVAPNGRLAVRDSVFRAAANDGVGLYVADATSTLSEFVRNTFDANDRAAMRVTAAQLGSIGAGNVFSLNALPSAQHIRVDTQTTLRTSASWRAVDVPYRFTSNTFVDDVGAVIEIEAGATLEFASAGLRVNAGALKSLGTAEAPVTFTSASGNPNDWRGLGIASSSAENELRHTVVENAGMTFGVINSSRSTNVWIGSNARVAITDSAFRTAAGTGVYVDGAGAEFTEFAGNSFSQNTAAPLRLYSTQLDMIGEGNSFVDAPESFRHVRVEGATITTDQFVRTLDVAYRFFGNHFIEASAVTMEIEPGNRLEFDGAGLRVNAGALRAVGTPGPDGGITFTSASGNSGGWRGVGIASGSEDNALQYVTMENAGMTFGVINSSRSTNLWVGTGGRIAVTDSAFNDSSGYGIYIEGTGVVTDQAGTTIDPSTEGNNSFDGNADGDVSAP